MTLKLIWHHCRKIKIKIYKRESCRVMSAKYFFTDMCAKYINADGEVPFDCKFRGKNEWPPIYRRSRSTATDRPTTSTLLEWKLHLRDYLICPSSGKSSYPWYLDLPINSIPSDKMNCTVSFVNCFLRVPLVYLPYYSVPFCQGKNGELSSNC